MRHFSSLFKPLTSAKPREWPDEFICPISKLPMADPVIVYSGQSYERRCIEAWMKLGQCYCYVSGTQLLNSTVIANLALKTAIFNWCQAAGLPRPSTPDPEAAMNYALKLINHNNAPSSENGYHSKPPLNFGPSQTRSKYNDKYNDDDDNNANSDTASDDCLKSLKDVSLAKSLAPTKTSNNKTHGETLSADFNKLSVTSHSHSARDVRVSESSSDSSRDISVPFPLVTKPCSFSSQPPETHEMNEVSCDSELVAKLAARLGQSHALEQEEAVSDLRKQTRTNSETRIALCHPVLLSALLPLLTSRYSGIQINAVAALVNISLEKENKVSIVRAGAVPCLIDVLKSGHPEAQEHATGGIFSLALSDENKIVIGVLGAIPPLLHVLRANEERGKQDAAMALYHLSFAPSNRSKLVRVGAVPILLGLAQDEKSKVGSKALITLCNIAATSEGRKALLDANAIATLVDILARYQKNRSTASQEIQEQTVAVLLLLSQNNIRFVSLAMQAGAMDLLVSLCENGNTRAKEKASALLSIIRELSSNEEECSDSILPRPQPRRWGRTGLTGPNSTNF